MAHGAKSRFHVKVLCYSIYKTKPMYLCKIHVLTMSCLRPFCFASVCFYIHSFKTYLMKSKRAMAVWSKCLVENRQCIQPGFESNAGKFYYFFFCSHFRIFLKLFLGIQINNCLRFFNGHYMITLQNTLYDN